MLYVLNPIPVAPYFTLRESLYWAAHGWYVSGWHPENEDFLYESLIDALFPLNDAVPLESEDEDVIEDLSKSGIKFPEKPVLPPLDSHAELEMRRKHSEWYSQRERYTAEVRDTINHKRATDKSVVFQKLRNGDIPAYGQQSARLRDSSHKTGGWKHDESWENIDYEADGEPRIKDLEKIAEGVVTTGFQKIPPEFWDIEGMDWDNSCARSNQGSYQYILLPSDALFTHFPQPDGKEIVIRERSGSLIYDDRNAEIILDTKTNRGRPSYNWPEFHAEVARYILAESGLPKMAALENHMNEWSKQKWGLEKGLSHGSMYPRLAPYYELESLKPPVNK